MNDGNHPLRARFKRPRRQQGQQQGDQSDQPQDGEADNSPLERSQSDLSQQSQQGETNHNGMSFNSGEGTGTIAMAPAYPPMDQQLFEEVGQAWANNGYAPPVPGAENNHLTQQQQPTAQVPVENPFAFLFAGQQQMPQQEATAGTAPPYSQGATANPSQPQVAELFQQFLANLGQNTQQQQSPPPPAPAPPPAPPPQRAEQAFNFPWMSQMQPTVQPNALTNAPSTTTGATNGAASTGNSQLDALMAAIQSGTNPQNAPMNFASVPTNIQQQQQPSINSNPAFAQALLQSLMGQQQQAPPTQLQTSAASSASSLSAPNNNNPTNTATTSATNTVPTGQMPNPSSQQIFATALASPPVLSVFSQVFQQWQRQQQQQQQYPQQQQQQYPQQQPDLNPATSPETTRILMHLLQQVVAGGTLPAAPFGMFPGPLQLQSFAPLNNSGHIDSSMIFPAFIQLVSTFQAQQQPASFPGAQSLSSPWAVARPGAAAAGGLGSGDPSNLRLAIGSDSVAAGVAAAEEDLPSQPKKKRKYNHEGLPQKLHRLITDAASNERERKIVRFTEDGTAFEICDTEGFEEILPRYFRHGKMSSFVRLLHMYGFKKTSGTWNKGTFEHPSFRRDEPENLTDVLRVQP